MHLIQWKMTILEPSSDCNKSQHSIRSVFIFIFAQVKEWKIHSGSISPWMMHLLLTEPITEQPHDYRNVILFIKISWRRIWGQREHHSAPYNSLFHRVQYVMPVISKRCLRPIRYFGKNGLQRISGKNIFTRIISFISAMNLIQKYLFSNSARNTSVISIPLSIPLTVRTSHLIR